MLRKKYYIIRLSKNHNILDTTIIKKIEFILIQIQSSDNHQSHAVCMHNKRLYIWLKCSKCIINVVRWFELFVWRKCRISRNCRWISFYVATQISEWYNCYTTRNNLKFESQVSRSWFNNIIQPIHSVCKCIAQSCIWTRISVDHAP